MDKKENNTPATKKSDVNVTSSIREQLAQVQKELHVPKDLETEDGSFKFRSAEKIIAKAKEHLERLGLLFFFSDRPICVGQWNYVETTLTLMNTSGESISVTACAREHLAEAGMSAAQITGSASSYARKTALCGLFAIDDARTKPVEDPDMRQHYPLNAAPAPAAPAKVHLVPGTDEWKRIVVSVSQSPDGPETVRTNILAYYDVSDSAVNQLLKEAGKV